MRNFNDDEFNDEFGDDFFGRWEKFNERMRDDREFRREMNKFQKDFEEMMRLLAQNRKNGGNNPFGMKFIPLSPEDMDKFGDMPEDEMDIEKGEDENGEWETRNWTSPDGSVSYTSFSRSSSFDDISREDLDDILYNRRRRKQSPEQEKQLKLAKLKKALDFSVETENYERAAELKKEIDKLNTPTEKTEE